MSYHPAYRAVDSVCNVMETFNYECFAVDYWTCTPDGVKLQYWNGTEWEEYDPTTFSKDG